MVTEISHQETGTIKMARHPVNYNSFTPIATRAPPLLGEHTAAVLEELGVSGERIAALHQQRIIQLHAPS